MATQSIFNLDNLRKAVQTSKTTGTVGGGAATQPKQPTLTMPTGAVGALNGVKQSPLPTVLPQAAITAAGMAKTAAPVVPDAARVAAQRMVGTTSTTPDPNMSRANQALNNQANLVNTPFSYNADADPAYQAALRAAQQNLSVNQKNTNAQLRATGQGKSSYSETVANQLAHQSEENVANNILPQYAQQAYKQYQDSIANNRNLYQDYNQQDFQNPITESQVTGNYLPTEAKQAIQNLLGLKTQAETKGITKDARTQLSTEADAIRSQLKSLGIDPSFYGANKTAAQASVNNPGIRTLQGQQLDLQGKQANMDAASAVSNMTGKVITPQTDWQGLVRQATDPNTPLNASQGNFNRQQNFNEGQQGWSNQFDKAKFDEDTRRYGLDYALQQQQIAISQQNANSSSSGNSASIANSQFGQLMDVWKATGTAPAGLESYGVNPGTKYTSIAATKAATAVTAESYATSYIDKSVNRDDEGKITNLDSIKAQVLQSGLPDSEIAKLYSRYGIPLPQGYSGN
ncbi:hypothetical protein A3842_11245 [Paenibacillus sp. P3E]|uniref:hypothetical protein n=1 Tax=Paenibacillus sp. P3E TaxID=1349435 RepID=UPI00093E4950|nr:hypothetical protein [Paenibacillus sp. P3E]OKP81646.1 hypothetical protein A3842_11245 [Paenibacillus sp. P3E]